jgi:hypothetical protein
VLLEIISSVWITGLCAKEGGATDYRPHSSNDESRYDPPVFPLALRNDRDLHTG